jgi:hypothetical protein
MLASGDRSAEPRPSDDSRSPPRLGQGRPRLRLEGEADRQPDHPPDEHDPQADPGEGHAERDRQAHVHLPTPQTRLAWSRIGVLAIRIGRGDGRHSARNNSPAA